MSETPDVNSVQTRAYALDALRGAAILLMVLSGLEPFGSLPSWMYHAQVPPPEHSFNPDIAGITWVDLVFPFFIFSMGAAFPLALSRRLSKGISQGQLVLSILKRGAFLLGFAIYVKHFYPWVLSAEPGNTEYALALAGFGLMFTLWGRFPRNWSVRLKTAIRAAGLAAVVTIFSCVTYKDGGGFSLFRSNIILHILADLSVFGAIIWLFTRSNYLWRIGVIAVLFAIRLSYSVEGSWIHTAGNYYQIPFMVDFVNSVFGSDFSKYFRWLTDFSWILEWRFLKYLFIIIPATIAGDYLLKWVKTEPSQEKGWSKSRLFIMMLLMFSLVIVQLVGLKARWVFVTFIVSSVLCVIGLVLFRNPVNSRENVISGLFGWGVFWLILGLLLEPYEGGIKKDPSTMSYYFVTSGLSIFVLIGFSIIIDFFKRRKVLQLLIDNGQNPMIAYLGNSNVITPLLGLFGLRPVLNRIYENSPWWGFAVAVFLVFLIALMVRFFTRRRIFLRT